MGNLEVASFGATVLLGIVTVRTGRSPMAVLHVCILHLRASTLWVKTEAIPAIRAAAGRYRECLEEVRRWT